MDPGSLLHLADAEAALADPRVRDDCRSDCVLALYELGDPTEAAARAACRRVGRRHRDQLRRAPLPLRSDVPDRPPHTPDPDPGPPRKPLSPAQRRLLERNVVIAAAASRGVPQSVLARVFGLPQPHVSRIVKAIRSRAMSG